jgi:hypothetical protein
MTVRAMKARKSSRLACGCYVQRGHLIARQGDGWICVEHAIAAIRAAQSVRPATRAGRTPKTEG